MPAGAWLVSYLGGTKGTCEMKREHCPGSCRTVHEEMSPSRVNASNFKGETRNLYFGVKSARFNDLKCNTSLWEHVNTMSGSVWLPDTSDLQ